MSFSNGDQKFLDQEGLSHLWSKIKTRLDAKIDISNKGAPNGVAELGMDGKVIIDQLPAVTSTDNGKVLRVVDGAWAAVSLPSASGVSF